MRLLVDVVEEFAHKIVRAIRECGVVAEVDIVPDGAELVTPTAAPVSSVKVSSRLAQALGEQMNDTELDAMIAATSPRARSVGSSATPAARAARTGGGRPKIYTPAKTKREMNAALAKLRDGTLDAFVLSDIIEHGEARNADVRERLAKSKAFQKSGLSVESVDNVIWRMVNNGLIAKHDAE